MNYRSDSYGDMLQKRRMEARRGIPITTIIGVALGLLLAVWLVG